jgi:hypothetical protein
MMPQVEYVFNLGPSESPRNTEVLEQIFARLSSAIRSLIKGEDQTLYPHELTELLDYALADVGARLGATVHSAVSLAALVALLASGPDLDGERDSRALALLEEAHQMHRRLIGLA